MTATTMMMVDYDVGGCATRRSGRRRALKSSSWFSCVLGVGGCAVLRDCLPYHTYHTVTPSHRHLTKLFVVFYDTYSYVTPEATKKTNHNTKKNWRQGHVTPAHSTTMLPSSLAALLTLLGSIVNCAARSTPSPVPAAALTSAVESSPTADDSSAMVARSRTEYNDGGTHVIGGDDDGSSSSSSSAVVEEEEDHHVSIIVTDKTTLMMRGGAGSVVTAPDDPDGWPAMRLPNGGVFKGTGGDDHRLVRRKRGARRGDVQRPIDYRDRELRLLLRGDDHRRGGCDVRWWWRGRECALRYVSFLCIILDGTMKTHNMMMMCVRPSP